MSTLELLQCENEHKDNNFYGKGEDFVYENNETQEQEGEAQFVKSNLKSNISFVINKKPIYEYEGTAIYDLHIPAGTHFVFRGKICISTGIIRGLNKNDILDIILEDHSDFYDKDIIQDMHNPSDLYVVDKIK